VGCYHRSIEYYGCFDMFEYFNVHAYYLFVILPVYSLSLYVFINVLEHRFILC
jgi:hypothetical protein